jgi:hypothetical protein
MFRPPGYNYKILRKELIFCKHLESHLRKEQWYGSADPVQYQNVTDPEDWIRGYGII